MQESIFTAPDSVFVFMVNTSCSDIVTCHRFEVAIQRRFSWRKKLIIIEWVDK